MSNRKLYDAWIDYKNKNVYIKKTKFCREIGCSVDYLNKNIRNFETPESYKNRDAQGRFQSHSNQSNQKEYDDFESKISKSGGLVESKTSGNPKSIGLIDISKITKKRTPEEQIAYIQKSIQKS